MKRFYQFYPLLLISFFCFGLSSTEAQLSSLTTDQLSGGLREALSKGAQAAIKQLGQTNGFLTNLQVKIPFPPALQRAEKTLRTLKQDALADQFITTLNRAAEQAVPEATPILLDAIKQMSLTDAKTILTGTNTAATDYFKKSTSKPLVEKFLPIVKKSTAQAGVTASYKKMMDRVSANATLGGLFKPENFDVDQYVTQKTLDGLFFMIAEEEKKIRANPAARSSELLKKVFGVLQSP